MMRDGRLYGNSTDLIEIVQLSLTQLGNIWSRIELQKISLRQIVHSYRYLRSQRRRRVDQTLEMAVISSDCLRARTTRNKPFSGSDEVPGPEAGDSTGSCIVSVGGIRRTSERIARHPPPTESQFQL